MTTEKYTFKKGVKKHLDDIYNIQGIANGDWWDHIDDNNGDDIIITRDITIIIKYNSK